MSGMSLRIDPDFDWCVCPDLKFFCISFESREGQEDDEDDDDNDDDSFPLAKVASVVYHVLRAAIIIILMQPEDVKT